MRVILVALIITLSGCAVSYESTSSETPSTTSTTTVCKVNGQDCDVYRSPTGPRETVAISEQGDGLEGYDETFRWSVHPNATTAHITVVISGAGGAGPDTGGYGYELTGPGVHQSASCGRGGISLSLIKTPSTIIDQGMGVGDWSFRLCMEPTTAEYDIRVDVDY